MPNYNLYARSNSGQYTSASSRNRLRQLRAAGYVDRFAGDVVRAAEEDGGLADVFWRPRAAERPYTPRLLARHAAPPRAMSAAAVAAAASSRLFPDRGCATSASPVNPPTAGLGW